jgi:DNA-binding NarL/FixJ family response regulator
MSSGARGYVTKTMSSAAFCGAVLVVLGGGAVFPSEVLPAQSGAVIEPRERVPRGKRELEILIHLERGQSNKAIARALGLSLATVKLHVQSILRSTGARNRVEAIANARRMGLLVAR